MDSIARDGCSGSLLTLPPGFPTSSEVANMSILGSDLKTEYCGRGPLEAAGLGIAMSADDCAFRINLTTVADGVLKDFSGGHISQANAEALIGALNETYGSTEVTFHPGVSYRNILILSGSQYSHQVEAEKPDDNHGQHITDHLPSAKVPRAEETAALLRKLMLETPALLEKESVNMALKEAGRPMANSVWPWSGGKAGALKTLAERYEISGAVISAVPVIKGLGKCLGMDVIEVEGATGYVDTNYEGKTQAAIDALQTHDFVYLHVEAIDEVSHEQNLAMKIKAIEDFDSRVIAPVLSHFGDSINVAVLPDHPVPIATGKHTRTPVPVAVRMANMDADQVTAFSESDCAKGALGSMRGADLMNMLFTPQGNTRSETSLISP
jgi:2,3-bisphosphoglycerate-independent phosphoglycerate mutase